MKDTIVVCGFPGVGKSYISKLGSMDCIDLDSSKFHSDRFPQEYINAIISNLGKVDYIFAGTHSEVLDNLESLGIDYILVYPSIDRKLEFIHNYISRGNSEKYISKIFTNWDNWIRSLSLRKVDKIILYEGRFLTKAALDCF